MKAILFCLLLLFGLYQQGNSQVEVREGLYFNKAGRQIWIVKTDGQETSRGLLYRISKDSVYYVETPLKTLTSEIDNLEIKSLHYSQIDTMVTLKNKPGAKGAVAGGLIGFGSGVIISAISYQSSTDPISQVLIAASGGETMIHFGVGLLGATVGAAAGAGIGSIAKKKWVIGGLESNFQKVILELDKRAYWNRSSKPKPTYKPNSTK